VLPSLYCAAANQATVRLQPGLTWEDCPVLGVWCELVSANFGHVVIGKGPGPAAVPAAAKAAASAAAMVEGGLLLPGPGSVGIRLPAGSTDRAGQQCMQLLPGKMQMYWKVSAAAAFVPPSTFGTCVA